MSNKLQFHLERIKNMFPEKSKLNQTQLCKVKGISTSTFNSIINSNTLEKLPKFEYKELVRSNGRIYRVYQFDVFDIAEYLADNINKR